MDQTQEQLYVGFNRQLYRIGGVQVNETGSAVAASLFPVSTEESVNSWADMGSGVFSGNVEVGGGYIQSGNFISGTQGWKLSADGTIEAVDAILSGTINASSGTIGGTTITSTALTGGIIQTATSGDRIVISGADNEIQFYDGSDKVGAIIPRVGVTAEGMDLNSYSDAGVIKASITVAYIDADNAGIVMTYDPSDGFAIINFQECVIGNDLDPDTDETVDLGNSATKYDNIWCATINRTSESSPSDIRLKENVIGLEWGLAEISAIRPVSFNWKNNGRIGYGFIAQELQAILPDLVSEIEGRTDGFLQIEASALVPVLVKAVQELKTRVDELENKRDT